MVKCTVQNYVHNYGIHVHFLLIIINYRYKTGIYVIYMHISVMYCNISVPAYCSYLFHICKISAAKVGELV